MKSGPDGQMNLAIGRKAPHVSIGLFPTRVIMLGAIAIQRRRCVPHRLDVHVERQLERDEVYVCVTLKKNGEHIAHVMREVVLVCTYMSKFALHEHFFGRLFAYSVTSSCLLDRVR